MTSRRHRRHRAPRSAAQTAGVYEALARFHTNSFRLHNGVHDDSAAFTCSGLYSFIARMICRTTERHLGPASARRAWLWLSPPPPPRRRLERLVHALTSCVSVRAASHQPFMRPVDCHRAQGDLL